MLKIDFATHKAAKHACLNWHYSKAVPAGKLVKFGAWEDGHFIGVVMFGRGANRNMASEYGLEQTECVELVRIALRRHHAPVSKIAAISIRLVVSYADPRQGHHGGIYQAGNWIYTGLTKPDQHIILNGKLLHRRTVYSRHGTQAIEWLKANVDPNARHEMDQGKHKYLMPLDEKIRQAMVTSAKPYPKREKQAMAGPPAQRRGSTDPHAPIS